MKKGKIWLVPTPIGQGSIAQSFGMFHHQLVKDLQVWVVENAKSFRAFLASCGVPSPYDHLHIVEISKRKRNQHGYEDEAAIWKFLKEGTDVGLVSDAGCPGIADPGSHIVQKAHDLNIEVEPVVGPSSIFLALMASGLNGQQFSFHGYLPIKEGDFKRKIQLLESNSRKNKGTQIFIETPYRNNPMWSMILSSLSPATRLCVGYDLHGANQFVKTKEVGEWKSQKQTFDKKPCVFLFQA